MTASGGTARPDLHAHRGFAADNPENTLTAVTQAAESGADYIELDVRRAGCGTVVVHHDTTVDRVTDATGPLTDYTAAQLSDFDVLDSGDGIPTLESVIEAIPPAVGLNVELKEQHLAEDVLPLLDDVEGPVIISSFSEPALKQARSIAPEIDRALLVDRRPRTAIKRARALDCTAVHPRARLCLRSLLVRRAHAAELTVNVWTVNSTRIASWLTKLGVDGIITDSNSIID